MPFFLFVAEQGWPVWCRRNVDCVLADLRGKGVVNQIWYRFYRSWGKFQAQVHRYDLRRCFSISSFRVRGVSNQFVSCVVVGATGICDAEVRRNSYSTFGLYMVRRVFAYGGIRWKDPFGVSCLGIMLGGRYPAWPSRVILPMAL